MAKLVKEEFENKNSKDLPIGNINPIDQQEFMRAIKVIKLNKATSNDCVTDTVIE